MNINKIKQDYLRETNRLILYELGKAERNSDQVGETTHSTILIKKLDFYDLIIHPLNTDIEFFKCFILKISNLFDGKTSVVAELSINVVLI